MLWFIVDEFEKDYHDCYNSACECGPEIRMLMNGSVVLIHKSLVTPGEELSEQQIEMAIKEILSL